jgi:hypothetical protein
MATAAEKTKKAPSTSSWSKRVGAQIAVLLESEGTNIKDFADKAGLNAARLKRQIEGNTEFDLGDFISVANALEYTPGGLLTKCLKS